MLKAVPGQGIELIRVMTWVPGMLAEVRSQAVAGFTDFDSDVLDDRSDLLCPLSRYVPVKPVLFTSLLRAQQTCSTKPIMIHKFTA